MSANGHWKRLWPAGGLGEQSVRLAATDVAGRVAERDRVGGRVAGVAGAAAEAARRQPQPADRIGQSVVALVARGAQPGPQSHRTAARLAHQTRQRQGNRLP